MNSDQRWPRFVPAGDAALLVQLGSRIDPATNRQVHALARRLAAAPLAGLGEAVPAYASLLVHYDPAILDGAAALAHIQAQTVGIEADEASPSRLVEIPTVYGGEYGPDLNDVAATHGIAPEEVIRIHAGGEYLVYMVGFTPGFAYLGGLDPAIATPRLDAPRQFVRAGSVGIAGSQTGVYPSDSPGGWRLIGWTPLQLFDPGRQPPALLAAGDQVRFLPLKKEDLR